MPGGDVSPTAKLLNKFFINLPEGVVLEVNRIFNNFGGCIRKKLRGEEMIPGLVGVEEGKG